MIAPHEIPIPGLAAAFADRLAAQLPRLETARLVLRGPRLGDFEAWAAVLTDARAVHMGGPFGRDDAIREFAAATGVWLLRGHGYWTVEHRDGGEVVGFTGVGFEPGDREPELGWFFLPGAEGQGYATEAAAAARDHAIGPMGLPALVSYIDPPNTRSIRVAERLGARREADLADASGDICQVWRHWPEAARPPQPHGRPA